MSLDHDDIIAAGEFNRKSAAEEFLCMGIQSWGQSAERIEAAVTRYLRSARFNLPGERAEADEWLDDTLKHMPRGKFEREVAYLAAKLKERTSS